MKPDTTSDMQHPDWLGKPYYSLDCYLKQSFGEKIYRLSLDGGFSCPNRDGTLGTRGCSFCSAGGSGDFAADRSRSVTEQLAEAKSRIAAKTNARHFIAYFQAYTNTYADISYLRTVFSESLQPEEIVALSIATRVDCLPEEVLHLLCELRDTFHKPVWVELGVQSTFDASLRQIRSGFTYADCEHAILQLHKYNIPVIAHLILGLPGETQAQMQQSITRVCALPVTGLKLQLLHILDGTDLAAAYRSAPFPVFSEEEYCQFIVTCIEHIPPHIVLHRITGDGPKRLLIAPLWSGNKKHVLNRIHAIFRERNTWQGKLLYIDRKRESDMAEPLTTYKLMILALLERSEAPLSGPQLCDFFLEKEYTNYFTVQEALHELDESAFIKKESTHNNTRYSITPAGTQTLSFFQDKLSSGIYSDIYEYLNANRLVIREAASVLADYYKAPGEQFAVRCQLKEREHSRIDLTITVPNEEIAVAICDNWKQQSEHVYEYLMDLLVK